MKITAVEATRQIMLQAWDAACAHDKVLSAPKMNSVLVEFEDGFQVIVRVMLPHISNCICSSSPGLTGRTAWAEVLFTPPAGSRFFSAPKCLVTINQSF